MFENEISLSLKPLSLPVLPDFRAELFLKQQGFYHICGADEVGRGPLAGPVVTAAVILDAENLPLGLNDSKKLTAARRAALSAEIMRKALSVSFAALPADYIDSSNIRVAALAAMRQAVESLALTPDYALIDGRDIPPGLPCPASALIKGDGRSLSIAAASILAKHRRDSMMAQAGEIYPAYGFGKHAGYGTAAHQAALVKYGAVRGLHRFSFAPLKNAKDKTKL